MVAVGLVATVAAALLSTERPIGGVELSWEAKKPLPDSRPAAIPNGGAMRISEAGIRATAPNVSGYRLYRVAATLGIDAGASVGQGEVRCTIHVPPRTIVAHTPGNRASYPRPSGEEELGKQEVPADSIVEFTSHNTDLASVSLGDAVDTFANEPGVFVNWIPFRLGQQGWKWRLPSGRPAQPLKLPFASIWRTTATPAARIDCTVATSAGSATVRTAGALK